MINNNLIFWKIQNRKITLSTSTDYITTSSNYSFKKPRFRTNEKFDKSPAAWFQLDTSKSKKFAFKGRYFQKSEIQIWRQTERIFRCL